MSLKRSHTGTHIDFPAHIILGGETSSDFPLKSLIGNGLIIEIPPENSIITKDILSKYCNVLSTNDFVFFKTQNSRRNLMLLLEYTSNYVYLEPEAAEILVTKGVKIVGIDYINPDNPDNEDLLVHHILLSRRILIVEGLNLTEIPAGKYKIYIIPIDIPGMDGLPTRVFAEKI